VHARHRGKVYNLLGNARSPAVACSELESESAARLADPPGLLFNSNKLLTIPLCCIIGSLRYRCV
jgi:hypothetical protein